MPFFQTFSELYQCFFTQDEPLTLVTTACQAAAERSRELVESGISADDQAAFFCKLKFAALQLSEHLWFASVNDVVIVDLEDSVPPDKDKITVWSWDSTSYHMGYFRYQGPKVYLANPNWHEPADLTGAQYIGMVRSVQFK